jgi:site-specific DNA-methyltransferase (adenine-specific)
VTKAAEELGKIATSLGGQLMTVKLDDIEVIDRYRQDYGDLNELELSMRTKGQLQNLVLSVNENGNPLTFHLLAGGRRFKVMTERLKWEDCRALVFSRPLTELEMLEVEWEENSRRKELHWSEDVAIKNKILNLRLETFGEKISKQPGAEGTSLRDTAEHLNVSVGTMSQDVMLAKAYEACPNLFEGAKTKKEASKLLKMATETMSRQENACKIQATAVGDSKLRSVIDRYIVGDFFDCISKVPDNCVDFVEIDPPYAIGLTSIKKLSDVRYSLDDYNEVDLGDFLNFAKKVIEQCWRVMSEHSWGILWHGPDPWGPILYDLLQAQGFQGTRLTAKWVKPNGQTNRPEIYLANACEEFFYFRKGSPTIIRQGRTNIFSYSPVSPTKKTHPTEKPIELLLEILSTFCWENARVLIPFLGSGVTLLAAELLKLQGFGYEMSAAYKDGFIVKANELFKGK